MSRNARCSGSIRADDIAGRRDRAIVAVLIYTAARIGAVARLRIGSFAHDGTQWVLNFFEKGGKARIIPVRDDLGRFLSAYLDAAGLRSAPREEPLFRRLDRRSDAVTPRAMTADDMGRMMKRRMAALEFPTGLCPHTRSGWRRSPTCSARACRSRMSRTWSATRTHGRRDSTTVGRSG